MPHNLHNTPVIHPRFRQEPDSSIRCRNWPRRIPPFPNCRCRSASCSKPCCANVDGKKVSDEHVKQLANWGANDKRENEIPFIVARGVAGLHRHSAAGGPGPMRGVVSKMGKNPKVIEPLVPVDLVVDHSVQIDHYGNKDALDLNMKLERSATSS